LVFSNFSKMLDLFSKIIKENGEKKIRSMFIFCLLVKVKKKTQNIESKWALNL
jgi:hypothetical protein